MKPVLTICAAALLAASAMLSPGAPAKAFEDTAGGLIVPFPGRVPDIKLPAPDTNQVKLCARLLARNKTLGIGCFIAHFGYRCAVELLKAIGLNEVARELEHMGETGANVLRKMFEEKKDDVASG